jgi:hypothetical protein
MGADVGVEPRASPSAEARNASARPACSAASPTWRSIARCVRAQGAVDQAERQALAGRRDVAAEQGRGALHAHQPGRQLEVAALGRPSGPGAAPCSVLAASAAGPHVGLGGLGVAGTQRADRRVRVPWARWYG